MNINELISEIQKLDGIRNIVAVAGAPASGKSTLAETLVEQIPNSALLAMDGFHFDDVILDERGHRARKGAPHTYDVDGFKSILARVAIGDRDVAVPTFDRNLELSRNCARIIPASASTIIVEGNYLLFDDPKWAECREYFDFTIMLHVDLATIQQRLVERWKTHGREEKAAQEWIEKNDLPNARLVVESSVSADLVIHGSQ